MSFSWGNVSWAGAGAFVGVMLLAATLQLGLSPAVSATCIAAGAAGVAFVARARSLAAPNLAAPNLAPPTRAAQLLATQSPAALSVADDVARAAADGLPDALVLYSDGGVIRYCNPAARALFFDGEPPEGKNFIRLVADAPPTLREALLGENDRLFGVLVEGWRESFHLSRRQVSFMGEQHTLLLVKHLTRELGRREVDVLKRVVRLISHEANNSLAPIASLVNSARLIGKRPEHADKLEGALNTIEERARHLAAFLEGYARLARLPEPQVKAASWGPVLAQVASLYPEICLPAPPSATAWFDAIQLEQVLVNLIKNAIEAGSAREAIELQLKVTADGSSELQLLDRGSGFTEEAHKQALLPLYTTKEHGSGMGLALSVEIIEAHGGSLAVGNRPGGGACVRFVLPGKTRELSADLTRSRLTLTHG